jgi:hypothetical protein
VAVYVGFTAKWANLKPSTLLLLIVLKATKWTVSLDIDGVLRIQSTCGMYDCCNIRMVYKITVHEPQTFHSLAAGAFLMRTVTGDERSEC